MNLCIKFFLLLASLVLESAAQDQICADIVAQKETIFWIGLLRTRFILITNTLNVYDLPISALNATGRKLHLSHPKALKDIYPPLEERMASKSDGFFAGGNKRLTVVDQTSEYLFTETAQNDHVDVYDVQAKNPIRYSMLDSVNPSPQLLAISSVEVLQFYVLYHEGTSGALLTRVAFKGGDTLPTSTMIQRERAIYHICQGTSADQVILSTDGCQHGPVQWSAVSGFVDRNNFYLIGNRTVVVFAASAFGTPGMPVTVHQVGYEDFFVCSSAAGSTTSSSVGRKRGSNLTIIVIGVVILLFACCFVALVIGAVCLWRPRRKTAPVTSSSSKKVSVQQPSVNSNSNSKQLSKLSRLSTNQRQSVSTNTKRNPSVNTNRTKATTRSNATKRSSRRSQKKKPTKSSRRSVTLMKTRRSTSRKQVVKDSKRKKPLDRSRSTRSTRTTRSNQNTIRSKLKKR